jgi:hypothetical protein
MPASENGRSSSVRDRPLADRNRSLPNFTGYGGKTLIAVVAKCSPKNIKSDSRMTVSRNSNVKSNPLEPVAKGCFVASEFCAG